MRWLARNADAIARVGLAMNLFSFLLNAAMGKAVAFVSLAVALFCYWSLRK